MCILSIVIRQCFNYIYIYYIKRLCCLPKPLTCHNQDCLVRNNLTLYFRTVHDALEYSCRDSQLAVKVTYVTSPDPKQSAAIQWLEPTQTAGKKHPYLYTQCQVSGMWG